MSRSKSVAKSVRISSGAKSAANEESDLSTPLIWQIKSDYFLFETGLTINFTCFLHNILLPNKNVPKQDYSLSLWRWLLMDQMLRYLWVTSSFFIISLRDTVFVLSSHHFCSVSIFIIFALSPSWDSLPLYPHGCYENCQDCIYSFISCNHNVLFRMQYINKSKYQFIYIFYVKNIWLI